MTEQITHKVIMVRPAYFGYNHETAENNSFQTKNVKLTSQNVADRALEEFDDFVKLLRGHGITVDVIEDTKDPSKPDAIFPNNWFTTHSDGAIITYPMFAEVRRTERREDVVEMLSAKVKGAKRYGFEYFEGDDKFLEGTGSMILDRQNKIVYACLSPRTHIEILDKFAVLRSYRVIHFSSFDRKGEEVYHTNVMMTLGEHFVLICLESIRDKDEREELINSFVIAGKEVIEISYDQMESFAGNMLQLKNMRGDRFIVMSLSARKSLHESQIASLAKHGTIISPDIFVVETIGGGSTRCMIAENFLPY